MLPHQRYHATPPCQRFQPTRPCQRFHATVPRQRWHATPPCQWFQPTRPRQRLHAMLPHQRLHAMLPHQRLHATLPHQRFQSQRRAVDKPRRIEVIVSAPQPPVQAGRRAPVIPALQRPDRAPTRHPPPHRHRRPHRLIRGPQPACVIDRHNGLPRHHSRERDHPVPGRQHRLSHRASQIHPAVPRQPIVLRFVECPHHRGSRPQWPVEFADRYRRTPASAQQQPSHENRRNPAHALHGDPPSSAMESPHRRVWMTRAHVNSLHFGTRARFRDDTSAP